MKVYIVTSGCYSDYFIDRVFLDKSKAEEYVEWCSNSDCQIEEYETDDENEINKFYEVEVRYRVYLDGKTTTVPTVKTHKTVYSGNLIWVMDYKFCNPGYLEITKSHKISNENWDEEFYTNKFTKAMYDTAAQVKGLYLDGYSTTDINKMLKNDVLSVI